LVGGVGVEHYPAGNRRRGRRAIIVHPVAFRLGRLRVRDEIGDEGESEK
jgi:hypothetical protein